MGSQLPPDSGSGGTYPPQQGQPQQGYPPPKKNRLPLILGGVALVVALIAAAILVPPLLADDEEVAGETFLEPGEIFLQPAADNGPQAFSTSFSAPPPPELAEPASTTETEIPTTGSAQVASNNAGEVGLYGGTQDQSSCDREQMIAFMAANPDKAEAFVGALNADANLQWSGGQLTAADLPTYLGALTPALLRNDTRVTNHGFSNGTANPIPMVLQAGTAVLLDSYGVPRARCACGNPLVQPTPSSQAPKYVGKSWPSFSPTTISVVNQSSTVINTFILTDPSTGQQFSRPAGSTGTNDTAGVTPPGTPTTAPTAAPTPTATAAPTAAPTQPPTTAPTATPTPVPTTPPATPQPTTAPPTGTPQIEVAAVATAANGDVDYSLQLRGYPAGATVTLTCGDDVDTGGFYTEVVTVDAAGEYFASPFCYTGSPGFFVSDDQGNRS